MPMGASASPAVTSSITLPAAMMSATARYTSLCSSPVPAKATPGSGAQARPRFFL